MIRLFVLIGVIGGTAIAYLATYGVGPEAQLPPEITQLAMFEEEGLVPNANDLEENTELEHDVFEVPEEDAVYLAAALEEMSGMDMSGTEMAEGTTEAMDMSNSDDTAMNMGDTDSEMEEQMATAVGGLLISENAPFDREFTLTMEEWGYSDMQIDVKMGERIKFTVKNGGQIPHEFMFMNMPLMATVEYRLARADWSLLEHEALFEQPLVLPGGEFTFTVEITQAGSWMFMCMLPYHMQMGMMGQMATPGMAMDMKMKM